MIAIILIFLLSLFVVEAQGNITEKDALDAILQAEKDMEEMQEMGFGIAYVNDTLIEAKKAFEGVDYAKLLEEAEEINDTERREYVRKLLLTAQEALGGKKAGVNYPLVLEKTNEIAERKQRAYNISDSLRALELRIEEIKERGLNTAKAEELYSAAAKAFQNENYGEAEELIFQGNGELGDIEAEATLLKARYSAARANIISYFKRNWQGILITLAMLLVVGAICYNRITVIITRRKLRDMKLEKEVLMELMKKAQVERFREGAMSRETYDIKMGKYKERMLEINRVIPVLQAKLRK